MSDEKIISLGAKKKSIDVEKKQDDTKETSEPVYCSFCGRSNKNVIKMVKGPGVNICSECTMVAIQYLVLEDKMPSAEAQMILDSFWGKAR